MEIVEALTRLEGVDANAPCEEATTDHVETLSELREIREDLRKMREEMGGHIKNVLADLAQDEWRNR